MPIVIGNTRNGVGEYFMTRNGIVSLGELYVGECGVVIELSGGRGFVGMTLLRENQLRRQARIRIWRRGDSIDYRLLIIGLRLLHP